MSHMDDFETWLKDVQGIAIETVSADLLPLWRQMFDKAMAQGAEWRAQAAPSRSARSVDWRCAIAIGDGNDLGLTFWIKRSARGDIYLLYPREPEMNPHASYHVDGTYHQKSYGMATSSQKRQPLSSSSFKGVEHLGIFGGHGPGPRIQECGAYDAVFIAPRGVLNGLRGRIVVDLVEPHIRPEAHHRATLRIVEERTYKDASPWIVVAIAE